MSTLNKTQHKLHIYVPGFTYISHGPLFIDKLVINISGAYTNNILFEGSTQHTLWKQPKNSKDTESVFIDHCQEVGNGDYKHVICSPGFANQSSTFNDIVNGCGKTKNRTNSAENSSNILCKFTVIDNINIDLKFDILLYSQINDCYVYIDTYTYIYNPLVTKHNQVNANITMLESDLDRFVFLDKLNITRIQVPIYQNIKLPLVSGNYKYTYDSNIYAYTPSDWTPNYKSNEQILDSGKFTVQKPNTLKWTANKLSDAHINTYNELISFLKADANTTDDQQPLYSIVFPTGKYWASAEKRDAFKNYNEETKSHILKESTYLDEYSEWSLNDYFRFLPEKHIDVDKIDDIDSATVEKFTAVGACVYLYPKFIITGDWFKLKSITLTDTWSINPDLQMAGLDYFLSDSINYEFIGGCKFKTLNTTFAKNFNIPEGFIQDFEYGVFKYAKDDPGNILALEDSETKNYFLNKLKNADLKINIQHGDAEVAITKDGQISCTRDFSCEAKQIYGIVAANKNPFPKECLSAKIKQEYAFYINYQESEIPVIPNNFSDPICRGFVYTDPQQNMVGYKIDGDSGALQSATKFSHVYEIKDLFNSVDLKTWSTFNTATYNRIDGTHSLTKTLLRSDFGLELDKTPGKYLIKFDYYNLKQTSTPIKYKLTLNIDNTEISVSDTSKSYWIVDLKNVWEKMTITIKSAEDNTSALMSNVVIGKVLEESEENTVSDIYLVSYINPYEKISLNLCDIVRREYNSCLFAPLLIDDAGTFYIGRTLGYYKIGGINEQTITSGNMFSYYTSPDLFKIIQNLLERMPYAT